jgi:hypothetical protein
MDPNSKPWLRTFTDSRVIFVALAVAGAIFVGSPPLENTRIPVNEPQHFWAQDVNARSWQDPFAAVEKHIFDSKKGSLSDDKENNDPGTQPIPMPDLKGEQVDVLAVLLPGTPYSEDSETRRRARYAVVAGLNAKHFDAVRADRLGYFEPLRIDIPEQASPPHVLADCPANHVGGKQGRMAPIPYEWYQPPLGERQSREAPAHPVLVLWLRVEEFCDRPIERLIRLKESLYELGYDKTKWRIIGPYGSNGLRTLVDEASAVKPYTHDKDSLRFYSPYATAPDSKLLETLPEKDRPPTLKQFLDDKGVPLLRTIGNDSQLAKGLAEELVLRGLKAADLSTASDEKDAMCRTDAEHAKQAPSRVAIVAERDTVYGRNVLSDFSNGTSKRGFCVDSVDYLRGLDGELPTSGDSPQAANTSKPAAPDASSKTAGDHPSSEEIAAGQQQFDYLRRLSVRLRERDRELRSVSRSGRGGVRAIGVLGTDVHDKLLILQALKPEFPDAVFFTTDLDARFLHPREQDWARNLVVASAFGLRLGDEFQGGTPPFRDSYQTAVYLSTLLALGDARAAAKVPPSAEITQDQVDRWFDTPRIFEIGRTAAFDFTNDADAGSGSCGYNPVGCPNIHPSSSPLFPTPAFWKLAFIFGVGVLCFWLALLTVRAKTRAALFASASRSQPLFRNAPVLVTAIALQIGVPIAMAAAWPSFAPQLTLGGSPIVALEGISTWPTEIMRLFIVLLAIYLILRSRVREWENLAEIGGRFFPEAPRRGADANGKTEQSPGQFWRDYVRRNNFRLQTLRTAMLSTIVFLVGYALVYALGEDRTMPIRGAIARYVHSGLYVALLFMACFIVLFVAHVVVSCISFVKRLRIEIPKWRDADLAPFAGRVGMTGEFLKIWVELQLIALRTQAVLGLIYFPFIIPSLMMLSTSDYLSASRIPLGPVVLSLVGATIAVVCGWQLNVAAEASRTRALRKIDEALMRAHATEPATQTPSIAQLDQFRAAVLDLHEGAFAPFWEQTMFYALLIPFAAIGSSSLIWSWLERLRLGL